MNLGENGPARQRPCPAGALALVLTLALRELRGGLRRFGVFLACLALGVGTMATVGSLAAAVNQALARDAKAMLGGDLYTSLPYRPLPQAQQDFLQSQGAVSRTITLRAMASAVAESAAQGTPGLADPGASPLDAAPAAQADTAGMLPTLVEIKTVDERYPLYGTVELDPAQPLTQALGMRGDGPYGAAVDPELLERLGVERGGMLRLGQAVMRITATIVREPDKGFQAFTIGPRVLLSPAALAATGLVQPGSLVTYGYRLRLNQGGAAVQSAQGSAQGSAATQAGAKLKDIDPSLELRVTTFTEASPSLKTMLRRMELYLSLAGLTSLLIGGLGVGGAVDAYLAGKLRSMAILKGLGAPAWLVLAVYLLQVLLLAAAGTLLGLLPGAAMPWVLAGPLSRLLPMAIQPAIYPAALLTAAGFGLATAMAFALPPLLRAVTVPAAGLFRSALGPTDQRLTLRAAVASTLAATALAGLALWASPDRRVALYFFLGTLGAWLLLALAARGVTALARRAGRASLPTGPGGVPLFLALRLLGRSPHGAGRVMLSLGLGLAVLLLIALVDANLRRQVAEEMPKDAPSYFFIDIPPDRAQDFDRLMAAIPGVSRVDRQPMLRARITAIKGIAADQATVDPAVQWALRSERGLSAMATPPANGRVTAGQWWSAETRGQPLVSITKDIADGFHMTVGDQLTINLLGRPITLTVANLREVDWATLGMNFALIVPPGLIDQAPHTHIATVYATGQAAEDAALRVVTKELPGVSAIKVRDALESAAKLIRTMTVAVASVASATLASGLLVLGQTLGAMLARRRYEAVVLKTLGATRGRVLGALLWENLLLGLASGAVAALVGSLGAWLAVTRLMRLVRWQPMPEVVAGAVVIGLAVALLLGLSGLRRVLAATPWTELRNQ